MPTDRTLRVAIICNSFAPYEADMVRGVIRCSTDIANWRLVEYRDLPYIPFPELDLSQVDAVVGSFFDANWAKQTAQAGILAVNSSGGVKEIDLPRVATDDLAVGQLAATHLLERGYPNFGFLPFFGRWFSHRRLEGFRQVIEDSTDKSCHIMMQPADGPATSENAVRHWLKELPKPIGIMAANDVRARLAIDCTMDMGLRVPEDVGVIGVDNDEYISALAATAISSVDLDSFEAGYRAAHMLHALSQGQPIDSPQWIPPIGIKTRHSTDVTITEDAAVTRALQFIKDHCADPIGVEDVLAEVGGSRTRLETRMKKAIGKTPHAAILSARVDLAKKLLLSSNASMSEIAHNSGFPGQDRLSTVFRRIAGMTPSQFRLRRRRA